MSTGLSVSGDAEGRRRIRASLDESLLVEAAAGTGKTSELVRRIVAVLASGRTTVDRLVAVTFTRKAAGELKLRLRQELDAARTEAPDAGAAANLENALARLEEARIGTIHSFCADILRERPVEARVDPGFEELSEPEARRLYQKAFRGWMEERLAESSPGLRRALSRLAARRSYEDRPPADQLRAAGARLVEWRDFDGAWQRPPFALEPEIDSLVSSVLQLADVSARCPKPHDDLVLSLQPVRGLATWVRRAEQVARRDYDTLEGLLLRLLSDLRKNRKKGGGMFADGVSRKDVIAARDGLLESLAEFDLRAGTDLAALLQQEMRGLVARYEELKRRAGKLDFVDLLARVRNLLRDNADVRAYLQRRFTHIFVDEFQDTDPLQAEILLLLSADDPAISDWSAVRPAAGKLFAVGDPKQSIYRFRRADVLLYQSIRSTLSARGVGVVRLTQSFRARPAIQAAVNAAFAPVMNGDQRTGQPDYVPLDPHRAENPEQPCVVALPVPYPYGGDRPTRKAVDACLPEAVAGFIEWLLAESGWTVADPEDPETQTPIRPQHIAVLFRRFVSWHEDVTRPYVRGLEARGIPHLLLGARSFHRREEVETLRAALTAIEWPDDELSIFATLRGSLFSISDEALLRYRCAAGRLHPFRPSPPGPESDFQPLIEALALLADLHRQRNRHPVVATLNRLLEATRAHAAFALRPGGNQVLANVYRVCDLARSFELSGGLSFRAFVEELSEQAEREEDSAEAPVLETGAEGVRIMTVHAAKGLEFPVVILADTACGLSAREPERFIDPERRVCALRLLGCAPRELVDHEAEEMERDRAEGIRVAYVAATRARDLLVIPAVGDDPFPDDGWTGPLHAALYPARPQRRLSARAPGCPAFCGDTVLRRPPVFPATPGDSMKPGLHKFDGYEVVWWDPSTLRLDVESNFGLRQEEILAEPKGEAARESIRRYEQWRERRAAAVESGSHPTFDLFTATEAADAPPGPPVVVEPATLPGEDGRPSGRRFGTLVHALLRETPLAEPGSGLDSLARLHGRVMGAPEEEVEAAIRAVAAALDHPLLRRARNAERCRRELPLMLKLEDGRIVEGILDLAFLESGVWNVVDFKTDAGLAAERYRRQLGWYVYALSRITGMPARGWLLHV